MFHRMRCHQPTYSLQFLAAEAEGKKVKLCTISFLIMTSAGMFCGFACAEEGGSGHY